MLYLLASNTPVLAETGEGSTRILRKDPKIRYISGMEDTAVLLEEFRRLNEEWKQAEAEGEALDARRDALRDRRQLMDETWKAMWGHENMTLIQAKMIAHENVGEKKRRFFFDWVNNRDDDRKESKWTRFLRRLYMALGGK